MPASMALVALLLSQPAEAQTSQSIGMRPTEAGVHSSSDPSSSVVSEAGVLLVCQRLSVRELHGHEDALGDPDCRQAWFARATTHWMSGDITGARRDFDRLMRFKRHAGDSRIEEL
jgi:hypothetical protein